MGKIRWLEVYFKDFSDKYSTPDGQIEGSSNYGSLSVHKGRFSLQTFNKPET